MVVALHVEQRVLDHHRVVQTRPLRERNADQQSAVASSDDPQVCRRRDPLAYQLLGYRGEVVVDTLPVFLESGAMPLRTELSTTTDVRQNINSAALEPRRADGGAVCRRVGDLESAVGGEQRRIVSIVRQAFTVHDEEWNLRSVLRCRLELVDGQAFRVEHRWEALYLFHRSVLVRQEQRGRLDEAGVV